MENLEVLSAELNAYCEKHSLPKLSADDLKAELLKHANYLTDFIARWDAASEPPKRITRTYDNQFRKEYFPPNDVVRALKYYKWEDDSWGNDVSPSWVNGSYKLWIAPKNKDLREDRYKRYNVVKIDDDGQWIADLFEAETDGDLIAYLATFESNKRAHTIAHQ